MIDDQMCPKTHSSVNMKRRLSGTILMILFYFTAQSLIVIAHEYTHSTSAWLFGYTHSPFTVVWGNPITIMGWDEGVPYDQLFHSPGNKAEAVIGGSPLFMHVIFMLAGFFLLERSFKRQHKLVFFASFWFAVVNITELVAYIFMRPFIATGDTGRFNYGMNISPWILFILGAVLITIALCRLARRVGVQLDAFTDGSRFEHRSIMLAAGFIMFLWGSGLRIMSLYPDPQWKVGLIGVFAFLGWILVDRYQTSRTINR